MPLQKRSQIDIKSKAIQKVTSKRGRKFQKADKYEQEAMQKIVTWEREFKKIGKTKQEKAKIKNKISAL
jgi:hypothetical protein